jgi:HEAT repeat protein/cyclophilin family peptidyl-prolyl cis-trans isomerase
MRNAARLLVLTATCALSAWVATPEAARSRYAPLLSTSTGQDTLRNLALWEDQRATGDGKLFDYARSGSPLVRARALEVVGRIQDPIDAAAVIPALKDKSPAVVREAIFALGQIGNRDAVPALLAARSSAPTEHVELIAAALGKLGGDAAVEALVEMVRDFHAGVRAAAATALARNRSGPAAAALMLSVHDPDPSVKGRAIYAMEKQDATPRACATLEGFLEEPDPRVRAASARTLGKLSCQPAVKPLMRRLRDDDVHVVINAARALGELKARDAVRPLSDLVMSHRSLHVRATAAEALERIGDKAGRDALMHGLLDPSVLVRTHSIRGLAACLGQKSEMFVDQARRDGSRLVRAEAIECYGRAGITTRMRELTEIASRDKDPMMRAAAVKALGQLNDPTVPPLLPSLLRDPDFAVVTAAVEAIGARQYREAVPVLMETYDAHDEREFVDVQIEAVRVLGDLGAVEAESLLVDAASHPDSRVRAAAVESLAKLGKTPPAAIPDREFRMQQFNASRREQLAPPSGLHHAVIATGHGDIEVELFGDDAIQTVAMFMDLARKHFYKGLTVHRVVPNFVIQGGDPRGDGNGDAGFTVPAEVSRYDFGEGYLGIADAGKDTGSCQWFITLSPQPHLDGRYTIFGRVTKGMDVVWKVDRGDTFDIRIVD